MECVGETRETLHKIGDMCRALPAEAEHRGIDSEAMVLLLPAADPEAWGHITTSLKAGRLPVGYLSCDRCNNPWPCERHADDERHPLFVLGTWEQVWRDALDHETDALITIAEAVRYLDMQLTYMASYEYAPFEDFARDLRRCQSHLESVLHDGEQRETGAPCMECKDKRSNEVPLLMIYRGRELPWSKKEHPQLAHEDGWACPRCQTWSKPAQYQFAVKAEAVAKSEWLTDVDMETRTKVKSGTVRSWAREETGQVRKRLHSQRTVYSVEDVFRIGREKGLIADEDATTESVVA